MTLVGLYDPQVHYTDTDIWCSPRKVIRAKYLDADTCDFIRTRRIHLPSSGKHGYFKSRCYFELDQIFDQLGRSFPFYS